MSRSWSHYTDISPSEDFDYGTKQPAHEFFGTDIGCSFSFFTFDPGEGGPLHYHESPVSEIYFVLEGTLDIRIDDEVVEAGPGTVTYTPTETLHQPMNNYDESALLLAASGPGTEPQTVPVEDEWTPP